MRHHYLQQNQQIYYYQAINNQQYDLVYYLYVLRLLYYQICTISIRRYMCILLCKRINNSKPTNCRIIISCTIKVIVIHDFTDKNIIFRLQSNTAQQPTERKYPFQVFHILLFHYNLLYHFIVYKHLCYRVNLI